MENNTVGPGGVASGRQVERGGKKQYQEAIREDQKNYSTMGNVYVDIKSVTRKVVSKTNYFIFFAYHYCKGQH